MVVLTGVAAEFARTEPADASQPTGQVGVVGEAAFLGDDGELFVGLD